MIHRPDFIILDEPFSGLDPVNTGLLKKVILEEKLRGATIIFSDHVMTNVEELCDNLLMINNGKLIFKWTNSKNKRKFWKNTSLCNSRYTKGTIRKITIYKIN